MAHSKKSTREPGTVQEEEERLESVSLLGFYITPFGKKKIKRKGRDAVEEIVVEVDFDAVRRKVCEFFARHKEQLGRVRYAFTVKTADHRVRDKFLEQSIKKTLTSRTSL